MLNMRSATSHLIGLIYFFIRSQVDVMDVHKKSKYQLCSILLLLLLSVSAKAQSVYKTPSGAKFHLATCRMVNNVSKQISISEAVTMGLAPRKICKPLASSQNLLPITKAKGENIMVQCSGITKAGSRCLHRTSIANHYCFQHNPDKNIKSRN